MTIGTNEIANTTRAVIDDSSLDSLSLQVLASSNSDIDSITGAGSGAASVAAAGSISKNIVNNVIDARVRNASTVNVSGSFQARAIDNSSIFALSGAGSGRDGVRAATWSTNTVGTTTRAAVEDAVVGATSVYILAESTTDIQALSAGGSGLVRRPWLARVPKTPFLMSSMRSISGSAHVDADGDVVVNAKDDATIFVISGAGAAPARQWERRNRHK